MTHSMHVSGVELYRLFQEQKTWMCVHNVLDQRDKVLGDQVVPVGVGQEGDELGRVVMAALYQLPPGLGQL